jgi:hypothetical protein
LLTSHIQNLETFLMRKLIPRICRAFFVIALVIPLSGFTALESLFAPKPDLWERWTANDPSSGIAVDHDAWGDLLSALSM